MTITSYAQNFEDVILLRALKHVQQGFYIDVGAQDPVSCSVSLAFYELGWRGVHVEPSPYYAERIRKARPDEQVIEAAIASKEGAITFFEIPDTGLSTGDEENARRHEASGYRVRHTDVDCLPLSKILDSHKDRNIHWLKINVEGMELEAIESWSSSQARPWIVLVESTRHNSPEPNFEAWEPKLLALGYEFVYFDGLNRFYVSVDHAELKSSFGAGPNYFDRFVLTAWSPFCSVLNTELSGLHQKLTGRAEEVARLSQELEVRRAEANLSRADFARAASAWEKTSAELTADIAAQKKIIRSHEAQIEALKQELSALYRSNSWKITAPLRSVGEILKRLGSKKPGQPAGEPVSCAHDFPPLGGLLRARPKVLASQSQPVLSSERQDHPRAPAQTEMISGATWPAKGTAMPKLMVVDQLDTSAEAESVQRIYRQLTRARKQALENR